METESYDLLFKLILIGDSAVGKSNILLKYLKNEFDKNSRATVGVEFGTKNILINGKKVKIQIWDTAGQERYRSLTKIFYKNSSCAILVYDITKKQTFDELKNYWIGQIKESAPKDIMLAIVGNKEDLLDKEQVDENEARDFAKENNALFFSTSAKNSNAINQLFIDIGKKYTGWNSNAKIELNKEKNDNENKKINEEINNDNEENNENKTRKKNTTIKLKQSDKDKKKGCC